jgi:hypothetical protein
LVKQIKARIAAAVIDINLVKLETWSSPHPKSLSRGERDFEGFSGSPRPLGEGLGVRGRTTVLNMDLV